MVIDKSRHWLLHSVVDLAFSNIQYSPLKKQSENSTTAQPAKESILKLQAHFHPF